jgi:hypothetical protein
MRAGQQIVVRLGQQTLQTPPHRLQQRTMGLIADEVLHLVWIGNVVEKELAAVEVFGVRMRLAADAPPLELDLIAATVVRR